MLVIENLIGLCVSPNETGLDLSVQDNLFDYGNYEVMPQVDPDKMMARVRYMTDDQGRRIDVAMDEQGRIREVWSDQTFNGSTLVGYLDAVYAYDSGAGSNSGGNGWPPYGQTHFWLAELTTTYHGYANNQWTTTTLAQNVYTMDNTGQRLTNQVTDWENGSQVPRTEHYSYDDLNRLSTVDYGDPANDETQSYTFDAMGNRLSKVDNITGTENSTYNAANMLLTRGTNSYSSDADGNTLSGAGRTNSWDSENRLVQCVDGSNTSQYVYGADGLRRRSIVNGTTTDNVLDGSMVVRDLGYNNGVAYNLATYFIGPRGPEYRRSRRLSGPKRRRFWNRGLVCNRRPRFRAGGG